MNSRTDLGIDQTYPVPEEVTVPMLNVPLREAITGDCATDPIGFATSTEAYAVLRLHDAHGPRCRRFLAAHAYVSADLDD